MDAAAAQAIDPEGVAAVRAAFAAAGVPASEGDRIVTNESGWNPAIRNPVGGAVGLLQWLPGVLKDAPGSPSADAVAAMSRAQQADLVRWSFSKARGYVRSRPGDAYLWNFVPAYLHAPVATVVYPVGSTGWRVNAGFREPHNGPITVRRILAIGSGAEAPGGSPPIQRPSKATVSAAWLMGAAAIGVGALVLRGRS